MMNFLGIFEGFFDLTARSLADRQIRERRARHQQLIESLSSKGLEERLDALQSWIDSRQELRTKQQLLTGEEETIAVRDSMSRVLHTVERDETRVLQDMWVVVKKAEQGGQLHTRNENRHKHLTHA